MATLAVLLVWQQLLVREQQHTYCAVSSATSSSEVKILTQLGLEVREGTNGQDAIVKGVSF
ncbi:hypothetical protein H6S82_22245 [Planktothrix sp. FACHB-1355]|uniref:Uncharacterized protein n=1 Tax=Aerosakkonema funiforme FACHB-1375 TaxID=2949571 RepID=A0A926VDY3_9CYAN|nr:MULTISPECIES: hypothetical protein [Oscillatoriales]MBD2182080.1 hypothetical protein [Aerosakkonema funiforme FACHB-1375]MBD3561541.1 hypothetical protein [Planktothrix sp. FACHB-1355]